MALLNLLLQTLFLLPILILAYFLLHALYNITLHPLARFPGPKLAAATRLWEFYHFNVYNGGGRFSDVLASLHEKYGPIVRINPFELHISDRDMYDELFNFNPELDKRVFYGGVNIQKSPQFAYHAMLRKAFNPFFSKAAIARVEPLIRQTVEKLCLRIREVGEGKGVANLSMLFRFLTFDVVCNYSIAEDFGLLDDPEKGEVMVRGFLQVFKVVGLIQQAPLVVLVVALIEKLPKWLQGFTSNNKALEYVKLWQEHLSPKMRKLKVEAEKGDRKEKSEHPVLFAEYLESPSLPASEKTENQLRENAQVFVMAGMETTGFTLSMAMFQLLSHRPYHERLRTELATIWPEDGSLPSWHTLERLPFATAVLKESLRMGVGVMSHLHRINRQRPIQYKDWTIPPGTSVSMSQRFILNDPEIFPEPQTFKPERWMLGEKSRECDKWLVVFSRGARMCIGANLAWAELYLTLAAVVHRFDLELFETGEMEALPTRDFFVPLPENEAGIRVRVKSCIA